MSKENFAQLGFSSLFFDTLFGLVLFFGIDSFLELTSVSHFIFYCFSTIVLMHWWLLFKSADDIFDKEVDNSLIDLFFGIVELVLLDHVMLFAKTFDYRHATAYIIALFCVDLCWSFTWRYIGKWNTRDKKKITIMETELQNNAFLDVIFIIIFSLLFLFIHTFQPFTYIAFFIFLYAIYIVLTFRKKIINLNIF